MYITYISVARRILKFNLKNTYTRIINTRKCTPSLFYIMLMTLVILCYRYASTLQRKNVEKLRECTHVYACIHVYAVSWIWWSLHLTDHLLTFSRFFKKGKLYLLTYTYTHARTKSSTKKILLTFISYDVIRLYHTGRKNKII